jgi:hypothetical protein
MKKKIVDIVNFNADASCLSSADWLKYLSGGKNSIFFQWLSLYVHYKKKLVLGFPGATIADIKTFNPEAIELINQNTDIFEIIPRPFAHDIGLLRSSEAFIWNVKAGIKSCSSAFKNITNYYLPPEFMCNSRHISDLQKLKFDKVFINPERFDEEIEKRIPNYPYRVKGLFDDSLVCIPFSKALTDGYLKGIHMYSATLWNEKVLKSLQDTVFSWRDGESVFLIPDSINRENAWLQKESIDIERIFLRSSDTSAQDHEDDNNTLQYYPIHSFSGWLKEMKTYWFIERVREVESQVFKTDDVIKKYLWLQLISSDFLSSLEKKSPVIQIKTQIGSELIKDHVVYRKEKGAEGEELLLIFDEYNSKKVNQYLEKSTMPHIKKFKARMGYLSMLKLDDE